MNTSETKSLLPLFKTVKHNTACHTKLSVKRMHTSMHTHTHTECPTVNFLPLKPLAARQHPTSLKKAMDMKKDQGDGGNVHNFVLKTQEVHMFS